MELFDAYTESILINMGLNMILALSLYLPLSTGQLSIGQAGFMAVGAYTAAGLTTFQGAPFYPSILAGGIMAALVAFLVGFPALRLKGLYLALMTFGFGEIVRVFFLNFEPLGGARGIVGIAFETQLWQVYAVIAIAAVFLYRLSHSRMGRAFEAIKEDELAAESMGVNPTWAKLCAFAAGGFIAGIGGGLYAHYIQMDYEGNEAVGVQAAQKLIQRDKVLAIIGPAWSSVAEAVFPVCKREKVSCFSPTSTKPGISELHRPWSFRNSKNEDLLIPETMDWVMGTWKPKTAAILTDIKDSYSKDLGKRTFPNILRESGVEVVADLDYQTGDTDFSAIVTKVKAANPDIICLGSTWPEAANIMKEAGKQGLIKPYVCGVGCNNERLIDNAGKFSENTVMNVIFNPFVDDEQVKHYVAEFKKKAPDESLSWAWATYYDVPKMVAWAIERAGIDNSEKNLPADRDKVRAQLDQLKDYAGVTGLTTIDTKTGDAIKASTLLLIKDGKFTVIGQGEAKQPAVKK